MAREKFSSFSSNFSIYNRCRTEAGLTLAATCSLLRHYSPLVLDSSSPQQGAEVPVQLCHMNPYLSMSLTLPCRVYRLQWKLPINVITQIPENNLILPNYWERTVQYYILSISTNSLSLKMHIFSWSRNQSLPLSLSPCFGSSILTFQNEVIFIHSILPIQDLIKLEPFWFFSSSIKYTKLSINQRYKNGVLRYFLSSFIRTTAEYWP